MTSEKSQLKFARSEETGELIGFVSRHSKTRKLMGVREDSRFGKQICVLSEDLKGTLEPKHTILGRVETHAQSQRVCSRCRYPRVISGACGNSDRPEDIVSSNCDVRQQKDFLRPERRQERNEPHNRRCAGNPQGTQG